MQVQYTVSGFTMPSCNWGKLTGNLYIFIYSPRNLRKNADVNEVGVGKTQTLVGNFLETFVLVTVYSKNILYS